MLPNTQWLSVSPMSLPSKLSNLRWPWGALDGQLACPKGGWAWGPLSWRLVAEGRRPYGTAFSDAEVCRTHYTSLSHPGSVAPCFSLDFILDVFPLSWIMFYHLPLFFFFFFLIKIYPFLLKVLQIYPSYPHWPPPLHTHSLPKSHYFFLFSNLPSQAPFYKI